MTTERRPVPAPAVPSRLTSLDGLRGVAAVVVLIHHALLTVPFLARAYYPASGEVPDGSLAWWLTYTPLHLVWGGTEAVFLFFVLSGLVVTLPVLRAPRFDWVAFYPRRIVRIYGPAAAALLLAVGIMLLVPSFDDRTLGHWLDLRPDSIRIKNVLNDAILVNGTSRIVSPLWSLQWEILFSALLPLFVGIAALGRRRPVVVAAVVSVALITGSLFQVRALFYLSLFAIGALLIVRWDRLSALGARISKRTGAWPALIVLGLLSASAMWWAQGLGASFHRATLMRWAVVPGVVVLLLAAAFWRPAVRLLDRRLLQWLGRISFSLYLVHEPIVAVTRFALFPTHAPTWVSIAIAVPVAVGAAELFTRFVEAPFHRLARRAGEAAALATRDLSRPGTGVERAVQPIRAITAERAHAKQERKRA